MKEWVLSTSVAHDVRKVLKVDSRQAYEASCLSLDGKQYPICAISGKLKKFIQSNIRYNI